MFDIGWTEMIVIAAVAIVVVGPKELPGMLRTFGQTVGKLRRMSRDFQRQFDDALKEADLDEVRRGIDVVKKANPSHALKQAMAPVTDEMTEVKSASKAPVIPTPVPKTSKSADRADEVEAVEPAAPKTSQPEPAA